MKGSHPLLMIDVSMHSLRPILADEHLIARLARVWGWEAHTTLPTPAQLIVYMQDHHRARSIWERLTADERHCLYRALSSKAQAQSRGVPLESLRKKTTLSAIAVDAAVRSLSEQWRLLEEGEIVVKPSAQGPGKEHPSVPRGVFVFRECAESLLSTGRELFETYADRRVLGLSRLLEAVKDLDLEPLGRLCHVTVTLSFPLHSNQWSVSPIGSPFESRRRIGDALLGSLAAFDVFLHLDPLAQRLFLWLCERDGQASMQEVRTFLGGDGDKLYALLRTLETHGLAFDTLTRQAERLLFIPEDLLAVVKQEVLAHARDEQTYALFPLASEPATIRAGQSNVCYDLATIIGCTYHSVLETTKDGRLPKFKSTKIRPLLHGMPRTRDGQDVYVDQLLHAARDLGLLLCSSPYEEDKPRYQPAGPTLAVWARATIVEQTRRLVDWWLHSMRWCDVCPDGRLMYPSSSGARKTLVDQLAHCIPGQWYRIDALLFSIWKQQPLQLYDGYASRLAPGHTRLSARREQWMAGEGQRYLGMLSSTLYEAGLVSLGYTSEAVDHNAPPEYVQLTPLGASVLADAPPDSGSSAGPWMATNERILIVQPSFEVVLLEPDMGMLYELLAFAQIKHIGPVSTFQLSQRTLMRGLEAGKTVEGILDLFARRGQKELAQNVVYTLKDWTKGYKEVKLSEVFLLVLSEERVEHELYRALEGQRIEVHKLAPGTFIVASHETSLLALCKVLSKAGIVVRGQEAFPTRRVSR